MGITVARSDINGVRAFHGDLPGVCYGTLVFGVGRRDEPATMQGVTHLLEHLLLRLLEPISIKNNAVVDSHSLTVTASGSPEEVGQFLTDVVDAIPRLGNLSRRDLKFEKRIIGIEQPYDVNGPSAGLLTYRYGLRGIGSANFGAPTTGDITRQEIVDWAARWLRADNTTVAFSGALPATLDLRLPRGNVDHQQQGDAMLQTPALVASGKADIALSLLVPRADADDLAVALHHELFIGLRHRRGLIYDITTFTTPIDRNLTELVLLMDPEVDNIGTTLRLAAKILRHIARTGFSAAAVNSARIQGLAGAQRAGADTDYLEYLAEDELRGWPTPTPAQRGSSAAAVTSAGLAAVLARSASSLILAYDDNVHVSKKVRRAVGLTVTTLTPWQPVDRSDRSWAAARTGKKWKGKSEGECSQHILMVTDTALVKIGPKITRHVRFADIVLIGDRRCGCLTFVDARGRSVDVGTEDWKHSKSLRRAVLAKIDPSLLRKFPHH